MESSADTGQRVHGLWDRFGERRDAQTRLDLIEHYMPLAKIIAAKMYGLRPDAAACFDDYLQYARVGLVEAVDRYEVDRGIPFESYSTHRIRGAILNGMGHESEAAAQRSFWRSRVPDRLESSLADKEVTAQEASLQDLIGITVDLALGLVLDSDAVDPIDEAPQSNPYAATELAQFTQVVRSLVDRLPEREREIVKWHYFERMEFQSIAGRYRLSKGRISQLHGRAMAHLRELLDERPKLDRKV